MQLKQLSLTVGGKKISPPLTENVLEYRYANRIVIQIMALNSGGQLFYLV